MNDEYSKQLLIVDVKCALVGNDNGMGWSCYKTGLKEYKSELNFITSPSD